MTGLLASWSNVKLRSKMNRIALISTNAKRYPMQLRVPPRKVSKLPQTPGTELVDSGGEA